MKQRFVLNNYFQCILHSLAWFLLFVAVYRACPDGWLIESLLAASTIWLEMQVCSKNIARDRMSDLTLEESIAKMPLYDLVEAINQRRSIRKIVIGDSPD